MESLNGYFFDLKYLPGVEMECSAAGALSSSHSTGQCDAAFKSMQTDAHHKLGVKSAVVGLTSATSFSTFTL